MVCSAASVSCIAPTYNRRRFLPNAIEHFLRQDYLARGLIVVDDGTDPVGDLVPPDPRVRYVRLDRRHPVGAKRNLACREARGEIVVHWDDDDWYAPWRISYQVGQLLKAGADICGLDRLYYYDPTRRRSWEYCYTSKGRPWVAGNTLCYRKDFWLEHPFPEIDVAEDAQFVWRAKPDRVLRLEDSRFIVARIHDGNVSPKVTAGCYWHETRPELVLALIGDWASPEKPAALVTASLGVGDILRVTPLARVLHQSGYAVDMLIEPDYAETARLLEGGPEIRRVYSRTRNGAGEIPEGRYEIATFTHWSRPLERLVNARRKLSFDAEAWLRDGDSGSVERIAREIGWAGVLPAPIAVASDRPFDLPPGTLAIHTGCKPDWPWKKWHGFDEVAQRFESVSLIGTPADSDNSGTYFQRQFRWPGHVRDYTGKLDLRDTAALISQCAALLANDSGIMHLGAALGVPTFGVFGITSPRREAMPLSNMIPVTKGLDCEPSCRLKPWGRRDCERHLECLKTLSAGEVAGRIDAVISQKSVAGTNHPAQDRKMVKLGLIYHGHVFDASGYGNAARAYIHALNAAGVDLSVVDLSCHARQVKDELVESLVGRNVRADFQLFHGIPHVWAQRAYRASNAIAMTVWETDTMPTQWRNTLNHALETWLPCDFNIETFRPHIRRPLAKIPHPVMPRNGHCIGTPPELPGISADTFVVYSIFEWQDRKCPLEQIVAFLRAFTTSDDAVLVIKTNPGAASATAQALAEARRQTGFDARVVTLAEAWSEDQIVRLQRRGDCYLSLHRGEGWCYPLFEAACAGKPVVATAYSGPLEYLDSAHHRLVPFRMVPVRQQYMYYHSRMHWAEPDVVAASEALRWVYEHRDEAASAARAGAAAIRTRYSMEAIGALARNRLMALLQRTNPARWEEIFSADRAAELRPPVPIPGGWYDAAYFEHGIKSNWSGGYTWANFHGLFRDAAAYVNTLFPCASSFLDAGCAKGFLVKTLRETGREAWGFDHSPWAIDHAEAGVQTFLNLAAADTFEPSRSYDVLLAFDLLAHLSEPEIDAFLHRVRNHIRVGLLAVIPTYDGGAAPSDGDLSHITCKPQSWWHEKFLNAGWRQDALHRCAQQSAQNNELARKMAWSIYLYSAGN